MNIYRGINTFTPSTCDTVVWILDFLEFPPVRRTTHLDEPGGTIRQTRQLSVTTNGAVESRTSRDSERERGIHSAFDVYIYIYINQTYTFIY